MVRARRIVAVVGVALAYASSSARAHATDCTGTLASTCINDDTFWPHAGGGKFLAIGAVETIAPRELGAGLVTSYLSRPIVLHLPSPGGAGSDVYAVNDQVNTTFLFAYGLVPDLEVEVALPV